MISSVSIAVNTVPKVTESQVFIFNPGVSPEYQTCKAALPVSSSLSLTELSVPYTPQSVPASGFLILVNGFATYQRLKAKTGIVLTVI